MPFTPYHFGPSGFVGLIFRKWIDIPVFVLANVIVDVEVLVILLFGLGYPRHRYCHTLLIGAAVGTFWGVAAYPLRHFFKRIMRLFHLPYETGLAKMIISGILGVWLHVVIDGTYHYDVKMLWPNRTVSLWRMIYRHVNKHQIETICVLLFLAVVIVYAIVMASSPKQDKAQKAIRDEN